MQFQSTGDLPPRATEPKGNARHHLLNAFALLRGENERRHWAVVHACALGGVPAKVRNKALDALRAELEDIDAASVLFERLLWSTLEVTSANVP